ncbi:Nuclear transcription factor Y subunit [Musa troglodytarum]|uniref:Nuclear transcription factor Y subunit n=1 Tax=Musa troglodytarum TaxID=320322 RepID=A0A9E7EMT0_9LILI|nr:Nuclear transcription factor Y subunit [Musa troglodytarum]URD79958.1 Nuclear transcription factor Y subunit [Musa troglodytarum]
MKSQASSGHESSAKCYVWLLWGKTFDLDSDAFMTGGVACQLKLKEEIGFLKPVGFEKEIIFLTPVGFESAFH